MGLTTSSRKNVSSLETTAARTSVVEICDSIFCSGVYESNVGEGERIAVNTFSCMKSCTLFRSLKIALMGRKNHSLMKTRFKISSKNFFSHHDQRNFTTKASKRCWICGKKLLKITMTFFLLYLSHRFCHRSSGLFYYIHLQDTCFDSVRLIVRSWVSLSWLFCRVTSGVLLCFNVKKLFIILFIEYFRIVLYFVYS